MKRTILFLLVAILAATTMSAQETKKTLYVIDGKAVENFDGSQLQGKTIVNYTIDSEHNIHSIFTSAFDTKGRTIGKVKILSISKAEDGKEAKVHNLSSESLHIDSNEDVVFVMNGKIVPYSEIKEIPSSKIASMTVIKNKKDADYIKYANDVIKYTKADPKCIIKITTK